MAYRRRYARRRGMRRSVKRIRKKSRGVSRKRYRKTNKVVRMRLLCQVVPKPEVKVHIFVNGSNTSTYHNYTESLIWIGAFQIPSGNGYQQRVGNKIKLLRVTMYFETYINAPAKSDLLFTAGAANTANTMAVVHLDQAVKLLIVDDTMNTTTNVSRSGLQFKNYSSQQSNAPGGASDWWSSLDWAGFKNQGRAVRLYKQFWHSRGTTLYGTPQGASTQGGPAGMPKPIPTVRQHKLSISFGRGKMLEYPSGATSVPLYMPVLWRCGVNNLTANNPICRYTQIILYYTDV